MATKHAVSEARSDNVISVSNSRIRDSIDFDNDKLLGFSQTCHFCESQESRNKLEPASSQEDE